MRRAHIKTTLHVYAHVIPENQREAMENIATGTAVPIDVHGAGRKPSDESLPVTVWIHRERDQWKTNPTAIRRLFWWLFTELAKVVGA